MSDEVLYEFHWVKKLNILENVLLMHLMYAFCNCIIFLLIAIYTGSSAYILNMLLRKLDVTSSDPFYTYTRTVTNTHVHTYTHAHSHTHTHTHTDTHTP